MLMFMLWLSLTFKIACTSIRMFNSEYHFDSDNVMEVC